METNFIKEKVSTFIFVHEQEIILDFINKKRFFELENLTYVFLGNRPINKIENLNNVIVSRKLPFNIEQYPKFTSFTGWYSLIKNNLIKSEIVNLFEYDINYVSGITKKIDGYISEGYDFIGYFPMLVTDPVYIQISKYSDILIQSILKNTNVDLISKINNLYKLNSSLLWSSSSNSTWKVDELIKYVEWFEKFIEDIKDNEFCGHMHERSISFYYFIKNLKVLNTQGLMTHFQLNSHGTSPLPKDRFKLLYKNLN